MTLPCFVGWVLAALVVGLYLGERGRRLAAERWKVYGAPDAAPAPAAAADVVDVEGEQHRITEKAVERGAAVIKAMSSSEGFNLSDEQAEQMAREMLLEAASR